MEYNSNISINKAQHHRCFSPRELHRTHIEIKVKEMKKKQEKNERNNYLLSFSLFFFFSSPSGYFVFKNNKLKRKKKKKNFLSERLSIFIYFFSYTCRYIYITDMNIIDFFFLVFRRNDHHLCCILLFSSLIVPLSFLTIDKCLSTIIVFTDNND